MNKKTKFKIISWNVNGIRACIKKGFVNFVKNNDADIFCLQEVKADKLVFDEIFKNFKGYLIQCFCPKKGYSGTAVFSKIKPYKVDLGLGVKKFDEEGRVITFYFEKFILINSYFPNARRGLERLPFKREFNREMLRYWNKLKKENKNIIVCGDFNVAHKEIDLTNPKQNRKNAGFTMEEREDMDKFIKNGFIDSFRKFNSEAGNYTWWSYRYNARLKNIGWRIDYFLVSEALEKCIISSSILSSIQGSDHCPIELQIGF